MQRSGIDWTDYTVNPVKGKCPVKCEWCYARAMYDRFGWDPTVTWKPQEMDKIKSLKKPSKIFVGSTFELFVCPEEWLEKIFDTKRADTSLNYLWEIGASVKLVSFEPLLDWHWQGGPLSEYLDYAGVGWVIIGALTGTKKLMQEMSVVYPELTLKPYKKKWSLQPPVEWVREITEACDEAGIPVFFKDNLWEYLPKEEDAFWEQPKPGEPLYEHPHVLLPRQEFPEEVQVESP